MGELNIIIIRGIIKLSKTLLLLKNKFIKKILNLKKNFDKPMQLDRATQGPGYPSPPALLCTAQRPGSWPALTLGLPWWDNRYRRCNSRDPREKIKKKSAIGWLLP